MANPRSGGDDLPPLACSSREEVSPLLDDGACRARCHGDQATPERAGSESEVEKLVAVLQQLGIPANLERHRVKSEQDKTETPLGHPSVGGVYCKNLLLKDKKGVAYLVISQEDDVVDLKVVQYHVHAHGNVYFASRDSLWNLMRVPPGGAVTPLALLHPSSREVKVYMDGSLMDRIERDVTQLYFHPLHPDLQVGLTLTQLHTFLTHCDVTLHRLPSLTSYSAGRRFPGPGGGAGAGAGRGGARLVYRQTTSIMQATTADDNHYKSTTHSTLTCRDTQGREGSPGTDPELNKDETTNNNDTETGAVDGAGAREGRCEDGRVEGATIGDWQVIVSKLDALDVKVDVVPAADEQAMPGTSSSPTRAIPCKSLYMKDKRDNYFLLVCHQQQKVDFSNLKMHLKPKKKITPLDAGELWSLARIPEDRQNPFHLTNFTQPRLLVAVADNLQADKPPVLTFPHPAHVHLRVRISLQDLKALVRYTGHDVLVIPVKGSLPSIPADHQQFPRPPAAASPVQGIPKSPVEAIDLPLKPIIMHEDSDIYPTTQRHNNDIYPTTQRHDNDIYPTTQRHNNDIYPTTQHHNNDIYPTTQRHTLHHHHSLHIPGQHGASRDQLQLLSHVQPQEGMLYRVTSHIRRWIQGALQRLMRRMTRYLPPPVVALLQQALPTMQCIKPTFIDVSGTDCAADNTPQTQPDTPQTQPDTPQTQPDTPEKSGSGSQQIPGSQQDAKLARLRHLIQTSRVPVQMAPVSGSSSCVEGETEACQMAVLQDRRCRLFIIITTRDQLQQLPRHLRKLRTTFRSAGPLTLATPHLLDNVMSWQEGETTLAWSQEELHPLTLLDVDTLAYRHVRIGITGALYSCPDTTIRFDLPPLGVSLWMTCGELEMLLLSSGFRMIYLP